MLVTVDTGGTKTLVASFSADGSIAQRSKFPTPKDKDKYVLELQHTIDEIVGNASIDALVIGLPGRISSSGTLIHAGNLGWREFDLKTQLREKYDCPILIENDANLAGLAEARSLTSIPHICLYITVSTGIGTGIIINGVIDKNLSQSEGGQTILEYQDTLIEWEKFASGKAIRTRYNKLARDIDDPAIWHDISTNIAKGIVALAPIIRPDVVVIGGSIGTHFRKYEKHLNEFVQQYLHQGNIPIIAQAQHPEEAVIYGCYFYALDTFATT